MERGHHGLWTFATIQDVDGLPALGQQILSLLRDFKPPEPAVTLSDKVLRVTHFGPKVG